MTFREMPRWQPMASMVATAPSICRKREASEEEAVLVAALRHVLNDDVRAAKAQVQGGETASPAMEKLQGRRNLKLAG